VYDLSEKTEPELWSMVSSEVVDERASAMCELGERNLFSHGHIDTEGLLQTAKELWEELGDDRGIGRASLALCQRSNIQGNSERTLELAEVGLSALQRSMESAGLGLMLRERGLANERLGFAGDAVEDYRQSASLAAENGDVHQWEQVCTRMILVLGSKQRYDTALGFAEEMLSMSHAVEEPALTITALLHLSDQLRCLGESTQAVARLREALSLCTYLGETDRLGVITLRLGQTLIDDGKQEEGLATVASATTLLREAGKMDLVMESDMTRLEELYRSGHGDEAEKLYEQLWAYVRASHGPFHVLYRIRAHWLVSTGNLEEGDALFASALQICRDDKNVRGEQITVLMWGEALNLAGEYAKAVERLHVLTPFDFHHNVLPRAWLHASRAKAMHETGGDALSVELEIQSCLSLGALPGLAQPHAAAYEVWAWIRKLEGRDADARSLLCTAAALYVRAGRPEKLHSLTEWMISPSYLDRESTLPESDPLPLRDPYGEDYAPGCSE
jgi:tetratricopeptide (TPR) repeat protein